MILLIPFLLYLSITEKNFGYSLFLIISMTGQVMFVHVYADNYTIATSPQKEKATNKVKVHYSINWNKA